MVLLDDEPAGARRDAGAQEGRPRQDAVAHRHVGALRARGHVLDMQQRQPPVVRLNQPLGVRPRVRRPVDVELERHERRVGFGRQHVPHHTRPSG